MSPEQKARFLERMCRDYDAMEVPQDVKDHFKETSRQLLDKLEQNGSWSPVTQSYLDGMEKIDEILKNNESGKVCLLHDCDTCPKQDRVDE